MVAVLLDGVTKRWEERDTLLGINLRVEDGEALTLLGSSGSGKTTVLRMIAGLESPTTGDILFDGASVNEVDPADRDIAMVFQDGALLPHLRVRQNIEFPLTVRSVPDEEIAERVEAEARATGISQLLMRKPSELSRGQRQLAQIARAMVRRPGVFLIDEPLAGLDHVTATLMRGELRGVQRGYGVTTIYATHDFQDAMGLSDRVAVIDAGRMLQVAPPMEVYSKPEHVTVATLLGSPPMALLEVSPGKGTVLFAGLSLEAPEGMPAAVLLGVRPESWVEDAAGVAVRVTATSFQGSSSFAEIEFASGTAYIRVEPLPEVGDTLSVRPAAYHLFDRASGRALFHFGD